MEKKPYQKALEAKAFQAILYRGIFEKELPEGWSYRFRKGLTGRCYHGERLVVCPEPKTRRSLYVALHEVGHAVLHYAPGNRFSVVSKSVYVMEYEAEQFAMDKLREYRVAVPRKELNRAKQYVQSQMFKAANRGRTNWDQYDRKIAAWCGFPIL